MDQDLGITDGTEGLWNVWFTELHAARVGLSLKVKRLLFSGESPYQRIDILDTYEYGRMLVLYGSIMVTEKDEFFYHEMLTHPAMMAHPEPRKVLVVGGGDGGSLRELLKHPTVEEATMVEIDQMVVEKSREFFSWGPSTFDDPRVRLVFEDAARFMMEGEEKYDVLVIDSTDPVGPGVALFTPEFYRSCADRLTESGIAVYQTLSPWYHREKLESIYADLANVFPIARLYLGYVPTYPSAIWSFCFCSRSRDPLRDFRGEDYEAADLRTKYYNPDIHRAAFAQPNFMQRSGLGGAK